MVAPSPALSLALVLAAPGVPQDAAFPTFDPEPHRARVEALVTGALSSGQAHEMLTRLCTRAPSRLAGSPGAAAARAWAKAEMTRAGLVNVREEPVQVPRWVRGEVESLRLFGEHGTASVSLAVCALGGSVGTPEGGLEAEVVEVRSLAELEALGERARGRFVFFNQPMDAAQTNTFRAYGGAVWQRSNGAVEAARRGGVGAIVRSMTLRHDDVPHTGALRYADDVERVPGAAISLIAADELSRRLASGQRVRLRLELSCQTLGDVPGANVVGEIPGSERPEEILVVGGHLDAWGKGQGAHDDGAGCVQSIEAARLLLAQGLTPRRTIRVVLFANEENGMRGAHGYRAAHLEEMPRHVMALESDRGGFVPRGFETEAPAEVLPELRAMAALLEPIGADTMRPGFGGVDISPMRVDGVPLFSLLPDSQRYFDVHHSDNDTLEAVNPRELQLGAAAMAALLHLVDRRPEPLPRQVATGSGR